MSHAKTGYAIGNDSLQGFLKKSLILHVVVLALVFVLPYLHRPPEVKPPQVIEAVLVSAPAPVKKAQRPKPPEPKVVEPQAEPVQKTVEPPKPLPEPAPIPVPTPAKTIPQAAPKSVPIPEPKPQAKPAPEKPATPAPVKPLIKQPSLNTSAFDKEMQALQKEAMEADMRKETERANQQVRDSVNLAVRDKYQRLINQRVETKWNRPLSARKGMVTVLRISVLPGGEVSNVITLQSSGDPAFDASAEEAVRRASPLPVPDDPALFSQYFRTITFRFSPEDL